ncbi:MAG TPA: LytTR family DNA-binding domain-containing protein [Bacteroidia bacterium]|jgi:two-component system LytT family response regulator
MSKSNKISTLLVDDEEHALNGLEAQLVAFCPEVEVLGKATNAFTALDLIHKHHPELLFLDVEMPVSNGFDLLTALPSTYKPLVIFTTAFEKHAIKAIKYDATAYLLKPIDPDELMEAVQKARAQIENKQSAQLTTDAGNKIALSDHNGIIFVLPDEIIHIEGEGRYSTVHLTNGMAMVVSRNLAEFESELGLKGFFRVHKSHLVNCSHIKKIINQDGGFLEMSNGRSIEISRRKKAEFMMFLKT